MCGSYASLPQKPRSATDEQVFRSALRIYYDNATYATAELVR